MWQDKMGLSQNAQYVKVGLSIEGEAQAASCLYREGPQRIGHVSVGLLGFRLRWMRFLH